jgi:hypothetical protein
MTETERHNYEKSQHAMEGDKLLETYLSLGLPREMAIKCALIASKEVAKKLPNINFTPPLHRGSVKDYMQFWEFGVPSYLNALQRHSAWRSGGFRSTELSIHHKS